MATIGKVVDILPERHFQWRIEDFSAVPTEDGKGYMSPLFYFANASWYLKMFPNGRKDHESIGYICLYLVRKCSGPPISLDYTLILKEIGEKPDERLSFVFEKPDIGYGWCGIIKRSEFLKRRSEIGMPDVVTIICTMKYLESIYDATCDKVLQDWKAVMLDGDLSDILIKVKGEEFRLHRTVLAVRNSYFHSMFKCDMKEKNTGIVSIEDCEPDIFRTFIHFVYTGKVDKLTPENVCELYEVADKYQEDQLKKQCFEFMKKTLSEDTFCDFIALALKYDLRELFEEAAELFISKPNKIVRSVKWQNFAREYPTQENELIIQLVDRHVK